MKPRGSSANRRRMRRVRSSTLSPPPWTPLIFATCAGAWVSWPPLRCSPQVRANVRRRLIDLGTEKAQSSGNAFFTMIFRCFTTQGPKQVDFLTGVSPPFPPALDFPSPEKAPQRQVGRKTVLSFDSCKISGALKKTPKGTTQNRLSMSFSSVEIPHSREGRGTRNITRIVAVVDFRFASPRPVAPL